MPRGKRTLKKEIQKLFSRTVVLGRSPLYFPIKAKVVSKKKRMKYLNALNKVANKEREKFWKGDL